MKNKRNIILFVVFFAVVGAAFLVITKGATPSFSVQPESGQFNGGAALINDTGASGGKAIAFGAATPPPPTPTGCAADLLFCDDFSGAAGSKPDGTKWNILSGSSGWGVECWSSSPNNIQLDGTGNLKLTVRKESASACSNGNYTSGGVDTRGKFDWQYGKVEINAKLNCGGGLWPALWTSTGSSGPSWPLSGEIDFVEMMKYEGPTRAEQTLHGPSITDPNAPGYPGHWQSGQITPTTDGSKWCDKYHTYGAEWRQGSIAFLLDGKVTKTFTPSNVNGPWPFDGKKHRIIMDAQIGNSGGTINDADLPSSMLIDYIKVYK